MIFQKYFFYSLLFQLILSQIQINLYYINEIDPVTQHNCLRLVYFRDHSEVEIQYYCLSELPSQWQIQQKPTPSKFTFKELQQKNYTSEQLYRWSAPIDLIEEYQVAEINSTSIYWNCTLPRFGPQCQYQFHQAIRDFSSLEILIESFYSEYDSFLGTNLSCYVHLQCTRHSLPTCLQWMEICDGEIQCLDNGEDEKDCWQLEMNECQENEYRCRNGQCIPKLFFEEYSSNLYSNCIDGSDLKTLKALEYNFVCNRYRMPSFTCEDLTCEHLPFTSLCISNYKVELIEEMFPYEDNTISDSCQLASKCIMTSLHRGNDRCDKFCSNYTCMKIINETCSNIIIFFGLEMKQLNGIHFIFQKNTIERISAENLGLLYICYKNTSYDAFFSLNSYTLFNDSKCLFSEIVSYPVNSMVFSLDEKNTPTFKLYDKIRRYYTIFDEEHRNNCNHSNMYQCRNSSKCISIHRINDGTNNCPSMDDETMIDIRNNEIINHLERTHFKCQTSNKYIHHLLYMNNNCDCQNVDIDWCEDENTRALSIQNEITFRAICDGFPDLSPIMIDGKNHTDETECEKWECVNPYTRCDGAWNCPNGEDETRCSSKFGLQCSFEQHYCVSLQTNQLICLSIEQINDGRVDCRGGTDEVRLCRRFDKDLYNSSFYCDNMCLDSSKLCDGENQCLNGDDEQFCLMNRTNGHTQHFCTSYNLYTESASNRFLCDFFSFRRKSLEDVIQVYANSSNNQVVTKSSQMQINNRNYFRCHRGIDLLVWLDFNKALSTRTCLCPLSFYGPLCQYQSQRVALSVRFRALSDSWQTLFAIVISLIDESYQRTVHSFEQISFQWQVHCRAKFHFYLLYANRPKNISMNNSIQIDYYEKDSLNYRGSSLHPIQFSFLPVHRISILADIPRTDNQNQSCSNRQCIHGKCIRYHNHSQDRTFCHCDQGWSGDDCSISHICTCSSTSRCIGILPNNRSICVCRTDQFGSRCLLNNTIRQKKDNLTCLNGGHYISTSDHLLSKRNEFMCMCPGGFSGDRCERIETRLVLSFSKDITVSPLVYIHFLHDEYGSKTLMRTSIYVMMHSPQQSLVIYPPEPLRFVVTELLTKEYYFTVVEKKVHKFNTTFNKTISPSDRCPNISKLFNETFLHWPLIRRIKYYHLPCRNVSCFHDETQFCYCYSFNGKRLADCMLFDHDMKFDCDGRSECEHDSQCFQDDRTCPKRSMCYCQECSYGRRCQFSTSGFDLSLDAILGYQIEPDRSLAQQSAIVKFSLTLTIILVAIGLTDGFLSLITFKNKLVRDVGCGIYLLCSSITTIILSITVLFKFLILLNAQMKSISNRTFLDIQCYSLDFLVRICLHMNQWLTACVAVERMFITIRGAHFNKKKSRQSAKYVIVCLLIIIIGSSIQDPLHRRLIDERNDDNDEIKRTWCIVTFSSKFIRQFNSYMNAWHFLVPFTINYVSAIVLITAKSRQQLRTDKEHSYKQILRQQYQQHKNLLIAPTVLVLLGSSRLILTFTFHCMHSSDDAWLYIILYFISFIPPMLTFIIFILPSKFYLQEFSKSITEYCMTIQRHLHL